MVRDDISLCHIEGFCISKIVTKYDTRNCVTLSEKRRMHCSAQCIGTPSPSPSPLGGELLLLPMGWVICEGFAVTEFPTPPYRDVFSIIVSSGTLL